MAIVALPRPKNDMTIARAQMDASGAMPSSKGLEDNLVTEMQLCFIDYLIANKRDLEAEQHIEEFIYDDERMQHLPEPYAAWLWLARMALLIDGGNPSLSLGAAENALLVLSDHHLTLLQHMVNRDTRELKATCATVMVNLDPETNQPSPLPQVWRDAIVAFEGHE